MTILFSVASGDKFNFHIQSFHSSYPCKIYRNQKCHEKDFPRKMFHFNSFRLKALYNNRPDTSRSNFMPRWLSFQYLIAFQFPQIHMLTFSSSEQT